MKKGFTIAEMMLAIVVMAIIAAILIPALSVNKPNKNKMMFKKAYHIIESVVNDLINDEDIYREHECLGSDFFDEINHTDSAKNTKNLTCNDQSINVDPTKFRNNFASKLVTDMDYDADNTEDVSLDENPFFKTTDGISWYINTTNLAESKITNSNENLSIPIVIDVNGPKEPNDFYSNIKNDTADRFRIDIKPNGRIQINDELAKKYLKEL